jgi:hypothetical protein
MVAQIVVLDFILVQDLKLPVQYNYVMQASIRHLQLPQQAQMAVQIAA